jgi:hypothetical protein
MIRTVTPARPKLRQGLRDSGGGCAAVASLRTAGTGKSSRARIYRGAPVARRLALAVRAVFGVYSHTTRQGGAMKSLIPMLAAAALGFAAGDALAQTKTVTGKTKTITAEVEAIEASNREVTVKQADGNYDVWYVPPSVQGFDKLKIGDKVTARYYENIVVTVKQPGAASVDSGSAAMTKSSAGTGGTVAHQRTITATITAIDMNAPSITFTGPHDWKYTTKVEDKAALAKVKVGDRVDITWTEATLVTLNAK